MKACCIAVAIGIAAGSCVTNLDAHIHFVAGAQTPLQGVKLHAVNSNDFVLESGYVRTMAFNSASGYWAVDHPFTVAAVTPAHGGPEPGAPALGSWIHMGMVSATGPAGGEIGYWEALAAAPTVRLRVGETGTNLWRISENNGAPGSDPYGHVHGRLFTATKPGLYVIGFRFVDRSTNGTGRGPIHAPSDVIYVAFQAGITMKSPMKAGNSFSVSVGTQEGYLHRLQYTTNIGPGAVWISGQQVSGNDFFQVLTDSNARAQRRFYRVRSVLE